MKRWVLPLVLLLSLAAFLFIVAFRPLFQPIELGVVQLAILGAIATVIVAALRFAASKFGWSPGHGIVTLIVFAVSVVVGYFFAKPVIPALDDPMAFAVAIIQLALGVLGAAVVIYEWLLKKVLDGLETLTGVRFIPRKALVIR
jgi:hypothetical protein